MKGWVVFGIVLVLAWRFSRRYPVLDGKLTNPITILPYMLGFKAITAVPQPSDLATTQFVSGGANISAGPSINPLPQPGVSVTFDKL